MGLTPELASLLASVEVFLADAGRFLLRLAAMFFIAYLLMLVGSLAFAALRPVPPRFGQRRPALGSLPLRVGAERSGSN